MSVVKSFSEHQLIALQDDEWLERQRIAGRSVVFCLNSARTMISDRQGLTIGTLKSELVMLMKTFGCTQALSKSNIRQSVDVFVNKNFSDSENDNYLFKDGDLIKIGVACNFKGAVAKAGITTIKGNPINLTHVEMLRSCKKSLENTISYIKVGKRIGSVGAGIHHVIKNTSFSLISNHNSFGLDTDNIFSQPIILNKSQSDSGIRIDNGMTFVISPAISMTNSFKEFNCCFEKTIFINNDKAEVITPWEDN